MDAIILAGGKGKRMESDIPKPLVQVKGKPIIFHQLDYLENKVDKIIVSLGQDYRQIIQAVDEHYTNSRINYAIEFMSAGTAGGLKKALRLLADSKTGYAVAFNCDDITDINLEQLASYKENTICVAHPTLQFGRVVEKDGYATFEEKPLLNDWVSCGWYLFNEQDIFEKLPDLGMLEYDVFPRIILKMHRHEGFWKPLNTKKEIEEFEKLDYYPTKK